MRKIFLALIILTVTISASALDVPQLTGRVNDYAVMLTPEAKASIENKLANLEKSDSTQIVVLTIPSLDGDAIEEFLIRVAEKWKIGQSKIANGVILLIVKNDRKTRIEVGRGLEGKLTDLKSRRIISEKINPKLKAGDYSGGIDAGVDALISIVKDEFKSGDAPAGKKSSDSEGGGFIFIIILLFIIFIVGKISKVLGAAAGGIGAPIVGGSIFGAAGFGLLGLGVAGLVIGLIISLIARSSGGGGGFFPGGGGFGSSGGGDSIFSGGGGDFGGGGASGDW